MTDKDLRRLSRENLLSLLLEQSKEIEKLRQQLNTAEEALADRTIQIQKAGSIAEASLQLSGIFEAAQIACQQYTENIALLSQKQEEICAQREKESREEAQRILAQARKEAEELENRTRMQCEKIQEDARIQAEQYWNIISRKLTALAEENEQTRGLLQVLLPRNGKGK